MVVSPDGAVVEPRDGNVWVANDYTDDAVEAVIGAASLLYFLTATLCMCGIFFSRLPDGAAFADQKGPDQDVHWQDSVVDAPSDLNRRSGNPHLVLCHDPELVPHAAAMGSVCCNRHLCSPFHCLDIEIYLRMKQVGAKKYTNGKAILELKETRGALPQSIQEILDKHVK